MSSSRKTYLVVSARHKELVSAWSPHEAITLMKHLYPKDGDVRGYEVTTEDEQVLRAAANLTDPPRCSPAETIDWIEELAADGTDRGTKTMRDDDELIPWAEEGFIYIPTGQYDAICTATKKVVRFGLTTVEFRFRS